MRLGFLGQNLDVSMRQQSSQRSCPSRHGAEVGGTVHTFWKQELRHHMLAGSWRGPGACACPHKTLHPHIPVISQV